MATIDIFVEGTSSPPMNRAATASASLCAAAARKRRRLLGSVATPMPVSPCAPEELDRLTHLIDSMTVDEMKDAVVALARQNRSWTRKFLRENRAVGHRYSTRVRQQLSQASEGLAEGKQQWSTTGDARAVVHEALAVVDEALRVAQGEEALRCCSEVIDWISNADLLQLDDSAGASRDLLYELDRKVDAVLSAVDVSLLLEDDELHAHLSEIRCVMRETKHDLQGEFGEEVYSRSLGKLNGLLGHYEEPRLADGACHSPTPTRQDAAG